VHVIGLERRVRRRVIIGYQDDVGGLCGAGPAVSVWLGAGGSRSARLPLPVDARRREAATATHQPLTGVHCIERGVDGLQFH